MTATLIHFPALEERDALEFERFGTSSYTRANEEGRALLREAWELTDRSPLKGRVELFTGLVERLTFGRPEMVEEFVVLDGGAIIELRLIPPLLAGLLAAP